MHRNGYLGASGQKSDPAIRSGRTGIFPLSDDVCGIYLMFCAQFSLDFVTLTFDPLTLAVSHAFSFIHPTHIPILSTLTSSFPELLMTQSDHTITSHKTVTAHAPCHVTYHRGAKTIHIFEIPDPNLPIHFVTFRALRRRLSHVIGKK